MTQREEFDDNEFSIFLLRRRIEQIEEELLCNTDKESSVKIAIKLCGDTLRDEQLKAAKAQAVPEGRKLVPIEPTPDQFGGMARDVIQWMRFTSSSDQHSESLVKWLKDMGNEIPEWLYSEPEINHLSKHVISKGTIAAIIYKAMLAAAPEQNK